MSSVMHAKWVAAHHVVDRGVDLVARGLVLARCRCVSTVDATTPTPFVICALVHLGFGRITVVVVFVGQGVRCVVVVEFDGFDRLFELPYFVCEVSNHLLHIVHCFELVG